MLFVWRQSLEVDHHLLSMRSAWGSMDSTAKNKNKQSTQFVVSVYI